LPGCSAEIPWEEEARRTGLSPRAVRKLLYRHGYDGLEILEDATKQPELARTLCDCEQVLAAEVDFCVRREWAKTLPAVARRTGLGTGTCAGCRCALPAARFVGGILGWNVDTVNAEAARFVRRRDRDAVPALYGEQTRQAEFARWVDPTVSGEGD
jgi:glycerol-3-phosphate dehydrogenase